VRELTLEVKLPKVMKEQRYLVHKQLMLVVVQDITMADLWQPGEKNREHWLQVRILQKNKY
jgi:hypothetical protein